MRAVFFGSPEAALPSFEKILADGHRLELVVTQPDKPAGRGKRLAANPVKKAALERNIPVLQPERIRQDAGAFAAIQNIRADVHVVVAYGQIIPVSIIDLPQHKSINVHFSLLPNYRGASPVQWALLNGETKTGVTIFRLNEKMDEGEILATAEIDIRPGENAGELENRLARIGAELLGTTLARIADIVPIPQDHASASHAPKIRKEEGLLDWTAEAELVDRKVRAFTPRPSAFTFFKGQRLLILKGCPTEGTTGESVPGAVLAVTKEGLDICCGAETIYRIMRLQPESKKAMEAHAFSLNGRIGRGDILG